MRTSKLLAMVLLVAIGISTVLFPERTEAYSYGDPNMEDVAEAYKKMAAELNESQPNFDGARTAYETIKQEIDMHMGPQPSEAVLADLNAKDKAKTISDMQKILVLNIARRLESIEADFKNYKQNKMLIAKANATYEALSPQVKQKDPAADSQLRQSFDKSLQALGNPGLFGVGVKEPDLPAFQANKKQILDALKIQFKLESLEVGHFAGDGKAAAPAAPKGAGGADMADLKNWIPLAAIVLLLIAVMMYARKKRKR